VISALWLNAAAVDHEARKEETDERAACRQALFGGGDLS
jgi:hypothetical protein